MPFSDAPIDELLEHALSITDRLEREAWLQSVCREDEKKLEDLRSLILASEKTQWIDTPLQIVREVIQGSQELNSVSIGPFQLLRRLGKGGMGDVYLAQQHKPVNRLVAIKMIQQDLESAQILFRFQSEQQTLANMEHPNIARIIDAGITPSGSHYIAMEFVDGQQLLEYIQSQDIDVKATIGLMLQCCRAIQHAHQKGTIHRDIKPTNVLVTQVDGEPLIKVIDFGIAKALVSAPGIDEQSEEYSQTKRFGTKSTTTGVSPGTPRFMSPEQYSSNLSMIDTRSDIYSLGALLYTLLVNAPPFDDISIENLSFDELKEAITKNEPMLPSKRRPEYKNSLRGPLDAIVMKAMERDPEDRYQSVGELYEDLRNYLNDQPVTAYPESTWQQVKRFCKKHKILIASGTLAIAGLLAGLLMSILQERRAMRSEQQAKRRAYGSDLLLASMAISKRNYILAREMLDRHVADSASNIQSEVLSGQPRIDWKLLSSRLPQEPEMLSHFPTKLYFGLDLLDRKEVASGGKDSHLRIVERTTGKTRLDIDTLQKEINGLARSPDGKTIATGGDDGTVKFWDIESGAPMGEFQAASEPVYQIGWTPDSKRFITACSKPNASVWKLPDFQFERFLDSSNEALECLSIGAQGQIAYGSYNGVVRIAYLSEQGEPQIQSLSVFNARALNVNRCSTVVFSPSGKTLAVGLNNGYLILLRERDSTYHVVERVRFPTTVTAVEFIADESKIAIGEDNGSVHVMNLPGDWPTSSKLQFTKYFLDENLSFTPELDPADPKSFWKLVAKSEPHGLEKEFSLEMDRVYLEFTKPLKNVFFSDNYVREWTDEAGKTKPEWREIPKAVIFKSEGIELQFENRYRGWSDLNQLVSQGRLSSWTPHSKRVPSIVWDEQQNQLISFSEDGFIRIVRTDISDTMKVGAENIKSFVPLRGSNLAFLSTDDRGNFVTLDPQHNEPIASAEFLKGGAAVFGFVPIDDNRIIYPLKELDSKSEEPSSLYSWNSVTNVASKITQFPAGLRLIFLLGKLNAEQVAFIAVDEKSSNADSKKPLYLGCWDLKNQKPLWRTIARKDDYRFPKISERGKYISFVQENQIRMVDSKTGRERGFAEFPGRSIQATSFSPDEKHLVVALSDNSIECYRVLDGQRIWTIRTAGSPVRDMAWSKDCETLVCISSDGVLRTFDTFILQVTSEIQLPLKNPNMLKIAPEENCIYALERDGTLKRIPCGKN